MISFFSEKKIIIFLFFILFQLKIFSENDIYLKPISKVIVYNNIMTEELNPFIFSTRKFYIDETVTLQLIDEYEFSNGFYGDILKVKIIDGFYKNEIGYLYEENTVINNPANKNIRFFFKEKTYIEEYDIFINKDTVCTIEKSWIENGKVFTKIFFNNPPYKNLTLEIKDKNSVHFIINKFSEITYNLRKGKKVIKIVDSESLIPLKNAECSGILSDEYGIIYLNPDKNKKLIKIKKEGYAENLILDSPDENIFLAMMNPVDHVKYYDDRTSVLEKKFYKFLINSRNLSVNEKIEINILSLDDLSIFSYPEINLNDQNCVYGGFYLHNIPAYADIDVDINISEKNITVYHFEINPCKWIKINHVISNNRYKINNLNNGYYLLIKTNNPKQTFSVDNGKNDHNRYFSKKFLRNKTGDFYKIISNDEDNINLPVDEYEFLYFDISNFDRIIQKRIYQDELVSDLNKIKEDSFKINVENKVNENQFSNLFFGLWQKRAIKVNDIYVNDKDILEYLSDMKIEENNIIKFQNDLNIQGYYKLIDEKKMYIVITSVNKLINKTDNNEILKINPSLFNSQLVIPAYYLYQVGILQISYNKIYLARNMLYKKKFDQPYVKMESTPFFKIEFPQDEKSSKYKIFFVKTD